MFRHLAGSVELPATQESKKDVERVGRLLLSARYKLNEDFETLVMLLVMQLCLLVVQQLISFEDFEERLLLRTCKFDRRQV